MESADRVNGYIRRVLILGDNNTSTPIVKALLSDGLEVHLTTSVQRKKEIRHGTAIVHECDLTNESLHTLLTSLKPDILISTVAGGSLETQKQIIDAAVDSGVRRFIANEFGQDCLNAKVAARLPPLAAKAEVIRYLRGLSERGSLSWVGIALCVILDRGLLNGNLGFDLKWQSATLHGKGDEVFAASSAARVGQAVLAVIEHWDEVANQYLYLAGLTTTANEVIEALERTSGKDWTVGRADVAECVQEAERRIDRGFPDAGMFLMERSVLYDESLQAARPFIEVDARSSIGLKAEVLQDIVHHVVHEHRHHGGKADCGCG